MHLFADISSHGFGHLAITAPVLVALAEIVPDLQLTIRSALPPAKLRQRIPLAFSLIEASSDFGYRMIDAIHIDLPASAAAYRAAHADWPRRVAAEAEFLRFLGVDRIISNVSYLPLAGAAMAGMPAMSICSLNWADLFAHFFGNEAWAETIHRDMLSAYRRAQAFIRIAPGMPMPALTNTIDVGPISVRGHRHDLGLEGDKAVLVAMGGITHRLPVENWPQLPGVRWLLPAAWQCRHPAALSMESLGLNFTDLLASVDAIITKPGYGTFTEAAVNGTPVLYQRREDWPEQECLIDWLQKNGRCREIAVDLLESGNFANALAALWAQPAPTLPAITGARQAAAIIAGGNRSA